MTLEEDQQKRDALLKEYRDKKEKHASLMLTGGLIVGIAGILTIIASFAGPVAIIPAIVTVIGILIILYTHFSVIVPDRPAFLPPL